mgnify:CR=1 FL=1
MSLIDEVEKLRPPFNVSVLNLEAALFALEQEAVYAEQAKADGADVIVFDPYFVMYKSLVGLVGGKAPEFSLKDPAGEPFALGEGLKSGPVVLVVLALVLVQQQELLELPQEQLS